MSRSAYTRFMSELQKNRKDLGAAMYRMAKLTAELDAIARSGQPFVRREKSSEPLRRELADLRERLWGKPAVAKPLVKK